MKSNYVNFYNSLVNLTRNKRLYKEFTNHDTFSDRLIIFLFHFAFFLKIFKSESSKSILQEIYDYSFRQLELSIREIGYSDVTINKNMKLTNKQGEKFEILIKKDSIKNNEIKIDFEFKNPISPYEVLESPDSRKLGMLVKNIVINPI